MDEQNEKLEALERQKERMIHQYMSLQDKADAVNEEIYKVCCGIEALNSQIKIVREEIKAALKKAVAPRNGNGAHIPLQPKPRTIS